MILKIQSDLEFRIFDMERTHSHTDETAISICYKYSQVYFKTFCLCSNIVLSEVEI